MQSLPGLVTVHLTTGPDAHSDLIFSFIFKHHAVKHTDKFIVLPIKYICM